MLWMLGETAVNCPFCAESIKDEAIVCRYCRRDLAIPKPLMDANKALTEKVAILEAEVARLQLHAPSPEPTPPAVQRGPLDPLTAVAAFVLLPTVLLLVAHYLLVVKVDANLVWLRTVSIVLPAAVGFMLQKRWAPAWYWTAAMAATVAIASILGMSTVVHFVDGDPILPKGAVAWRETVEYLASIALAYILGPFIAIAAEPLQRRRRKGAPQRPKTMVTRIASFIAHHAENSNKPVEERVERLVKLMNLGISAATAAGAIYTGFKGIIA